MNNKTKAIIIAIILAIVGTITGVAVNININMGEESKVKATIEYSAEELPAIIESDRGEIIETTEYDGTEIKTVEEVDGGMFEDKDTGVSSMDGMYDDLGWSETYDTSSPEAFKNATLGKCIIANNRYGAQCVSLARVFWWSYANRDVSTCNTGMAKGMMNCWQDNAGNEFDTYWSDSANIIQTGDWLILNGGQHGHVGMALGPVVNGYVALLGENQGGASCGANVGGSATNIINISIKNLIGFYRPKAYIKVELEPEPTPEPVIDTCMVREVKKGDTMGAIMKECEGKIEWGEKMNEYARSWHSTKYILYSDVYEGWISTGGVGLFAGDIIERIK